nr:murein biosynthesis integral membrane protein MurJ [Gracilibacillus alcaliphilus]
MFVTTILLKISGLMRDMLIANYFGDSYLAEAYLAAFIIPNMIILFMQNGMKEIFVPQYFQYKKMHASEAFFYNIFRTSAVLGIVISIIGIILASQLIDLLYPAFDQQVADVAAKIMRILMAAIILVCMNAVYESYLDATYRYHLSTFSQMIVWVTMIVFTIVFVSKWGVYSLAYGYLLGAAISFLFKCVFVRKRQVKKYKLDRTMIKNYYQPLVPIGLTILIGQLNLMVDNIYASYFGGGAITYINYAKNLVHLPQTVIAAVIGVVLFSHISDTYAKQNLSAFQQSLSRAHQITIFLTLPAIVGLGMILPEVIKVLFERGAFQASATLETTKVAYFYLGSAFFFSLNIVWNKALYTMGKGAAIFKIGAFSVLLNIVLNYILIQFLSYYGIPLASSIVGGYYSLATYLVFRKASKQHPKERPKQEGFKVIIATIIMVVSLLVIQLLQQPAIAHIIISVLVGALSYFISCQLLRVPSFLYLRNHWRR